MLVDQTGEGLEISIRTGVYLLVESYMTIESTPTEHLDGTLRIARKNNTVTTYYWDNEWVIHAQWEPSVVVAEDLRITFFSWNWEPSYSALETQLDNLILNHGFITVCHNPETDNQKTLRLPAAALGAHLAHGDYIGEFECWEIYPVTIHGAAEEAWLKETFGESEEYWIGFNDIDQEGVWVWSSGRTSTYTNWGEGEPNNYNNEDAAVMNSSGHSGAWNDIPIGGYLRGIVERL